MQAVPLDPGPDMARSLAQHLNRFLARQPPTIGSAERREAARVAIPLLLRLAPLDAAPDDHASLATAVGKDLSRGGIGFFHREPLPHRHVLITFDDPRLERLSVEVELNRCRFSNLGWYESGGRLLRVAETTRRPALAG